MVQLTATSALFAAALYLSGFAAAKAPSLAGCALSTFDDRNCQRLDAGPDGVGRTCRHWGAGFGSFSLNPLFSENCASVDMYWHVEANCQGTPGVIYDHIQAETCYSMDVSQAGWVQLVCHPE